MKFLASVLLLSAVVAQESLGVRISYTPQSPDTMTVDQGKLDRIAGVVPALLDVIEIPEIAPFKVFLEEVAIQFTDPGSLEVFFPKAPAAAKSLLPADLSATINSEPDAKTALELLGVAPAAAPKDDKEHLVAVKFMAKGVASLPSNDVLMAGIHELIDAQVDAQLSSQQTIANYIKDATKTIEIASDLSNDGVATVKAYLKGLPSALVELGLPYLNEYVIESATAKAAVSATIPTLVQCKPTGCSDIDWEVWVGNPTPVVPPAPSAGPAGDVPTAAGGGNDGNSAVMNGATMVAAFLPALALAW